MLTPTFPPAPHHITTLRPPAPGSRTIEVSFSCFSLIMREIPSKEQLTHHSHHTQGHGQERGVTVTRGNSLLRTERKPMHTSIQPPPVRSTTSQFKLSVWAGHREADAAERDSLQLMVCLVSRCPVSRSSVHTVSMSASADAISSLIPGCIVSSVLSPAQPAQPSPVQHKSAYFAPGFICYCYQ